MEVLNKDLERFKTILGYDCNLQDPKTHNERLMVKKYNDRNPLLTITSDKIKVKEWADEIIPGNQLFKHRYYSSYNLDDVIKHLKGDTVLKMNNASGRNMFLYDNPYRDEGGNTLANIENTLKIWWESPYGKDKGEWCYEGIQPGAVLENIIFNESHDNYRFLCFNGIPRFVHIHNYGLYPEGHSQPKVNYCSTYNMNWNLMDLRYKSYPFIECEKPKQFEEMKEYASLLSNPFDFVRVDFMVSNNHVYLSELTHYPVSGKCKMQYEWDLKLGENWK